MEKDRKQRPVKKNKRNSRAAQMVQHRREEKKEQAHLENLREKQVKKAKRRNKVRRHISKTTWKRILIVVGIAAALLLSMIIFFRVHHIEVQGCDYYTAEEIIAQAGLEEGDNLLTISRGNIAGNVMAHLPYVATVQVSRQLPDTVVIHVTEYEATYAVCDSKGDYYLMTAGGKATEKIEPSMLSSHIVIEDLTIETPVIGEPVSVMAPAGQENTAETQLDALKTVLAAVEENDLLQKIASVSVPSSYDISLWYGDRFLVKIGDTSKLDYKLSYLNAAIEDQKPYATGTIDLTQAADKKVIVSLDK